MMPDRQFDADTEHPWAKQWRIPRVTTTHPRWRYEVALVVPMVTDLPTTYPERELLEPAEADAPIIGSYIDYRRDYYREGWKAKMLERAFDVDDSTNTVILGLTAQGWKYRRASYEHGLWPFWNMPEEQAKYPGTPAGLVALLDHINWAGKWPEWKAAHSEVFAETDASAGARDIP
jgi:hypothetical protein